MKTVADWGTRLSLLTVAVSCLAVAWRLTPKASIEAEPPAQPAKTPATTPAPRPVASTLPYRVNAPDGTFVLPETLAEISDLALAPDGESLWAVHDERGVLFRLATKDGAVLQTVEFHKKGDFEGVAVVQGEVVAGRSDGMLFFVDPQTGKETHLQTPLGFGCNLEGLASDPKKSRLLLACKDPVGDKSKRAWAVYALSLPSKVLQKEPVLRITRKQIDAWLAAHPEQSELPASISTQFDPSGIAVHPQSGLTWLISTRSQALMVVDEAGAIVGIEALDRAVHAQPEGIAFSADGTLFISSEARGGRAKLLRFAPQ